jgi:hypothetical protein
MSDKFEPRPVGRPRRPFKKEYCEMLIDHMGQGYSFESFAGVISGTGDQLYRWLDEVPEFADARKQGEQKCRLIWEKIGMNQSLKGKGSAAAWIFNMKNRFRWADNVDHNVRTDSPIKLQYAPADEDS